MDTHLFIPAAPVRPPSMFLPRLTAPATRPSLARHARQFTHNRLRYSARSPPLHLPSFRLLPVASAGSDDASDEEADTSASTDGPYGTAPTASPTDPQLRQFSERLDTARVRARQLHSLLIARYVQSATARANALLTATAPPPTNSSSEGTTIDTASTTRGDKIGSDGEDEASAALDELVAVARRMRKDLRSLRTTADEDALPADDAVWVSLARLQSLVEQLEYRGDSLNDRDPAYARDRLQEELEDGASPAARPQDTEVIADDGSGDSKVPEQRKFRKRISSNIKRTVSGLEGRVSEMVKSDGSIDVDMLRRWVRSLLNSASSIWLKLNGRDEFEATGAGPRKNRLSKEKEIETVINNFKNSNEFERDEFQIREEIQQLERDLIEQSKKREGLLRKNQDQLAVLMRAREVRELDDSVNALRRVLAVRVLQIELGKVFASIVEEIICAEYDVLLVEQRLLIFEFSELDAKLNTLSLFIEEDEPLLIDDDVLGELVNDIQDIKNRLGMDETDYYSTGEGGGSANAPSPFTLEQVKAFLVTSSRKTRAGIDFYWRGMKLFVGDVKFVWKLLNKVVIHGYTPNPREVRTLRRTGRDLLTLVPFTIVLIAPLTPVGHVLVFSFLQRYWPEFFPSTFSERRQDMMKKREVYLDMLKTYGETDEHEEDEEKKENGVLKTVKNFMLLDSTPAVSNGNGSVGDSSSTYKSGGVGGGNSAVNTEMVSRRVTSSSSGAKSYVKGGEDMESNRELDLIELTGGIRDKDKNARKQRNRIALDELHLAD